MSTNYLFTPEAPVSLPIAGSETVFPVRRVYCIARNYAAHAREMGGNPEREVPFFFTKPGNAVLPIAEDGSTTFPYPAHSQDVHHELEMVVALHSGGQNIAETDALSHVFGYALGLDMTLRDIQADLKAQGRPWDLAKGFDYAAPVGTLHPATQIGHPQQGSITLHVNDTLRQHGDLNEMIVTIPEIIAFLSRHFELKAGDLIFTGTPQGVGPVKAGDTLRGELAGITRISLNVA